jgi:MbtH protein
MAHENSDAVGYLVLINEEGQYSLWLKGREVPQGWRQAGSEGSKEDCLRYIKENWTDMTPLSLRNKLPVC